MSFVVPSLTVKVSASFLFHGGEAPLLCPLVVLP